MSELIRQSPLNKARKDKFLMVFDLPPVLKQIQSKYNRDNKTLLPDTVQFSIYGTVVPGVTVKGVPARYAGDTLYVSSHSKDPFPPVNIKFKVDSGYNNYFVIDRWLNLLHDEKTGQYNQGGIPIDGNFADYQIDMTVYGLDEYDNKVIKFIYTKAFPTSIDELSWDETATGDMEMECGFTFVFSQRRVELIGGTRPNFTTE
jgi:hypothetical protein